MGSHKQNRENGEESDLHPLFAAAPGRSRQNSNKVVTFRARSLGKGQSVQVVQISSHSNAVPFFTVDIDFSTNRYCVLFMYVTLLMYLFIFKNRSVAPDSEKKTR